MSGKTVFMFSGQGSQYYQMGKQLYDENAAFRAAMNRLDAVALAQSGHSVIEAIYSSGKSELFDQILYTHPAIFMVEYAMAQCLIDAGIEPDLTLGASMGSFAAAAVAGYIDAEDAMAAVLEQARAFLASCRRGGMLAVVAEPSLYEEPFMRGRSDMAGVNFDSHFAVSGAQHDLAEIEGTLSARGLTHQRLVVAFAFHSPAIDPAEEPFNRFMRSITLRQGNLPMVCCEQGATLTALPDDFFWRAVRRPMQFHDTILHLERQGPHRYIDAGPSGTLATFVKYGLPKSSQSSAHPVLTPYGRDSKNLAALLAQG